MPSYTVLVDDNYHYQDAKERYEHSIHDTLEAAIAACRAIVERSLAEAYRPGMSPDELLTAYKMFGEDPFVVGDGTNVPFSAWDYARERCLVLCGRRPSPRHPASG